MNFIQSNFPPLKTNCKTFQETFYELIPDTTQLNIAVGYITADSLIDLKKIIEMNNIGYTNLVIGMHYFDRFTKLEYNAAMNLNEYLCHEQRGEVRLVTTFRYHGKVYTFNNDSGTFAGIIGSNNLSSIVEGGSRVYESSLLIREQDKAQELNQFIDELSASSTDNIQDLEIKEFNESNKLLFEHENVRKVSQSEMVECLSSLTNITFDIPIKGYEDSPQSNLNVFFGKGRESKATGLVKPRHWYEVELIVPKSITSMSGYPIAQTDSAVFDVITDDGWSFKCKVSGDYNKNFRSEGDLKILGKWLKGRLENAGVLVVGEPVTNDVLNKYGRNSFTLTKTSINNLWYINFGVDK